MELFSIRCLVEVQVAPEDLVSPLTAEDHLAAGGLDPAGQEEHGSRSPNRREVERLKEQYRRS